MLAVLAAEATRTVAAIFAFPTAVTELAVYTALACSAHTAQGTTPALLALAAIPELLGVRAVFAFLTVRTIPAVVAVSAVTAIGAIHALGAVGAVYTDPAVRAVDAGHHHSGRQLRVLFLVGAPGPSVAVTIHPILTFCYQHYVFLYF